MDMGIDDDIDEDDDDEECECDMVRKIAWSEVRQEEKEGYSKRLLWFSVYVRKLTAARCEAKKGVSWVVELDKSNRWTFRGTLILMFYDERV